MPSKLKAAKELLETGIGSLTLKQMRSYGTKTRINPDQIKIGGKKGLYYDRDLPFVTKHTYFSPKGSKTEGKKHIKYRIRHRTESGEASGEDLITVYKTVGKNKRIPIVIKRKDARVRIDPKTGKKSYNLSHGLLEARDKVVLPLLKDIVNRP
jgi:AAA+ ATPase superfamily predicted ATPase